MEPRREHARGEDVERHEGTEDSQNHEQDLHHCRLPFACDVVRWEAKQPTKGHSNGTGQLARCKGYADCLAPHRVSRCLACTFAALGYPMGSLARYT
jgi:hypothetical protein